MDDYGVKAGIGQEHLGILFAAGSRSKIAFISAFIYLNIIFTPEIC